MKVVYGPVFVQLNTTPRRSVQVRFIEPDDGAYEPNMEISTEDDGAGEPIWKAVSLIS